MPTATITTQIRPADHGRALTIEEFLEADAEPGYRYELARGVLEVTQVPNDPHRQVVFHLSRMAVVSDLAHPGVILRTGGGGEFQLVMFELGSGRNPDFSLVLQGAPRDYRGRRIPVLVAEVVSIDSVDRDNRAKREEYLASGLLEYWIIDLELRKMTLLVRQGDRWIERPCPEGQPIPCLVLPGLMATAADLRLNLEDDEAETPTDD